MNENKSHRTKKELVLIDTWWNVNHIHWKIQPQEEAVLIDTWWNVN